MNMSPKGAKQAKSRLANMNFSIGCWKNFKFIPILIHTKVQRTGPMSLIKKMNRTATTNKLLQKQYKRQMKVLQQLDCAYTVYFYYPFYYYLGYGFCQSKFCLLQRQVMEGTSIKQRAMKPRYIQTIASINSGYFKTEGTVNTSLTPEIRQICIIPTYPYPKPHIIGPNNNIRSTLQQLLLDNAILPVRQIKQRMLSIGYRIEMRQAAPCTFLQHLSENLEVKTQQMSIAQYMRVKPREVKIMMGQEGLKLVEMSKYSLKEMARRSAMYVSGAFTNRFISLSIVRLLYPHSKINIEYESQLTGMNLLVDQNDKWWIGLLSIVNLNS